MQPLTAEALEAASEDLDARVAQAADLDRFCSATPWALSAHETLMPPRTLWAFDGPEGAVLLARGVDARHGPYLQPLEAMWGFASPVVPGDPLALAEAVVGLLREGADSWNLALLSGLVPESPFFRRLVWLMRGRYRLGVGLPTHRRAADIQGGVEGFLSRRSPRFRANLRRAWRRAQSVGMRFEPVPAEPEALLQRVLDIEARSWKGPDEVGMAAEPMISFYRRLVPRLARRGALRGRIAVLDGVDVAFAFGGVLGDTYRGLQTSYAEPVAGLSPGALAQLALIEALAEEGVTRFDMGQDIDYKRRWTEGGLVTTTLLVGR